MSEKYKGTNLSLLLKNSLKEKGLSLRKFSELTEIDPATISRIMNGKRNATPEHLQRFADCLRISTIELFISAGYPINDWQSDFHKSIDDIKDFLETSNFDYKDFTIENVEQELAKYAQYSQTEEGQETILQQFEEKLQKVNSTGPFINHLKEMYDKFRKNKVSSMERILIGSALIYFIVPVDCIPDYVFPIGFIDDAIVVKLVVNSLKIKDSSNLLN